MRVFVCASVYVYARMCTSVFVCVCMHVCVLSVCVCVELRLEVHSSYHNIHS